MVRTGFLGLTLAIFLVMPKASGDVERHLLWRVVQSCVTNHNVTGLSFPCLDVVTGHGLPDGYVVLRAPLEKSHIVVAPTVRTVGIEADRLRGSTAPNYFEDAWNNRFFATAGLARAPSRSDLALAVNSRLGRSQDQLHIHVDCIRPRIKKTLAKQADVIDTTHWAHIAVLPQGPRYWALALKSADLKSVNVFDLVAGGLGIKQDAMGDVTVVVVGSDVGGTPGFVVLARQRIPNGSDEAHGESLMDHSCPAFR